MENSRRDFIKKGLAVGAVVGVATALNATGSKSSGVVVGKSKKKEILYKKTQNWEDYYKHQE